MDPRDKELAILDRCFLAAQGKLQPRNKTEADIFRFAAMLLATERPGQAKVLWQTHEAFYMDHPGVPATYADLRRQAGLSEPGRFRDMLNHRMREHEYATEHV